MLLRCKQFGFDRKKINQHLLFLRLTKADHKLAQRLNKEVIMPNIDKIIELFYVSLLSNIETHKWLKDKELVERLKMTQRSYLSSLGIDFDSDEYFENRLQIGIMHAVVALPLSIYQGAYSNMIQFILDVFPQSIRENSQDNLALTNFVIRITSLDMSLAIETYHHSFMVNLEDEVKTAYRLESTLRSEAETDSLTGLYNRKYAFSHLNEAIGNAYQNSYNVSILMLDIDFFKKVNDTYGHQAGDQVLKEVSLAIMKTLRDHDIVGRYGGEEYIVGLVNITPERANQVAERIRNIIADASITIDEHTINVTVSIGMASLNGEENLHSLIKRSDTALYSAKGAGRNCVIIN
ncbi:MAG: diguanylate cyclase [Woeseiaceae bacterium]